MIMVFMNLKNMQLITYIENMKKGWSCQKSIESSKRNIRKSYEKKQYPVIMEKGNFRKIFKNIASVIREYPYLDDGHISKCVYGKANHHYGYTFKKIEG